MTSLQSDPEVIGKLSSLASRWLKLSDGQHRLHKGLLCQTSPEKTSKKNKARESSVGLMKPVSVYQRNAQQTRHS